MDAPERREGEPVCRPFVVSIPFNRESPRMNANPDRLSDMVWLADKPSSTRHPESKEPSLRCSNFFASIDVHSRFQTHRYGFGAALDVSDQMNFGWAAHETHESHEKEPTESEACSLPFDECGSPRAGLDGLPLLAFRVFGVFRGPPFPSVSLTGCDGVPDAAAFSF